MSYWNEKFPKSLMRVIRVIGILFSGIIAMGLFFSGILVPYYYFKETKNYFYLFAYVWFPLFLILMDYKIWRDDKCQKKN